MWTFRNAFLVIFALLVALPLSLFAVVPHSRAVNSEMAEVRDRHLMLARSLGQTLQRHHGNLLSVFDHIVSMDLAAPPAEGLQSMLRNMGIRAVVRIALETGDVEASLTDSPDSGGFEITRDTLTRLAAIVEPGRTVLSPIDVDASGTPTLYALRQVGTRLYVGFIQTGFFSELGKSIAFGTKGHAVIVDQNGRALAHPVADWVMRMQDLSKIPTVKKMQAGQQGVDTFYSPAFKDYMVAGFSAVPGTGWGVMVPQPISELRAKNQGIRDSSFLVFAFGLLTAALLALRGALLIVEPIQRVIAASKRIEDGETDVTLPPPSRFAPRELRVLTSRFNAMATRSQAARVAETEAREEAERANRFKTDFLRTVAHELRSPLNAIVGFADLLLAEKGGTSLSKLQQERVGDIRAGGEHLVSLTSDLLDLSRIEAGHYQLHPQTVGLDELTERCVRFLTPLARQRQMSFNLQSESMPDLVVDERAMFQVLLNITANAVKYGNEGGRISIESQRCEDGLVEIRVRDDGPGIPAADLARVLEPFERVSSERTRAVPGTGLGLPIVKRLVELHGGSFRLESELGIGTVAIVELPWSLVVATTVGRLEAAA